jgi:hypothetical protein
LAIPVAEIIRILITEIRDYRRAIREDDEPTIAASSSPMESE